MKFESKKEKQFLIFSCLLSALQGLLYLLDGFLTTFTINDWLMLAMDFLYVPVVLIFRSKGLKVYILSMTVCLVFITAFQQTQLFNNFSALLCLFMGIMIYSKHKNYFMCFYLISTAIAFCFNSEPFYKFLIHSSRAMWLFVLEDYIIAQLYNRKPLILNEEEQRIISQLCEGKLLKELELDGYSESTIRRRIADAKSRNGLQSTEELKELYLKLYSQQG